jgi:tetratricopeptide (TPR) repeat protein
MANNDIWIHLKTGEYVLQTGWVPLKDPYSFTAADHAYVAHEWLAAVLFYLVYAPFGVVGLTVFKALVVAAACVLLYGAARTAGARLSVMLPAFALLLYIGSARYIERPYIFAYLIAAVYLWLFFRYRDGDRNRRWLYLIVPADILWTNLHGSFIQGLAMLAIFAVGEGLASARARMLSGNHQQTLPSRDLILLAALVPVCVAASLLNPYGVRMLTFPFELTRLGLFMQRVYEWRPPYDATYNYSTMFFLYLAYVGALWTSFFFRYRDRRPLQWLRVGNALLLGVLALVYALFAIFWFEKPAVHWTPAVLASMLYALLGLFFLFIVLNLRTVDFTHAGLVAFFYLLSLRHNRLVTDAVMGTFVTLTASASGLGAGERRATRVDRSNPLAVLLGAALLLAVAAHASLVGYYYSFRGKPREKGVGISRDMPTCAVDFIERARISGNAFVSYSEAAQLIHRMYPAVKVNMDSRNDVYGEALYREYLDALASPEAMQAYLRRYPVDFFLLKYQPWLPEIFATLESTGEWAPVYYDDAWFVLVRLRAETEALVRREAFHVLRPYRLDPREVDGSNATELLGEAERAIRNCPSAVLGYFMMGEALRVLGRREEAVAATREVLARKPDDVSAYARLAEDYAAMGKREEAIAMLERAVRLNPRFTKAREFLEQLRRGR